MIDLEVNRRTHYHRPVDEPLAAEGIRGAVGLLAPRAPGKGVGIQLERLPAPPRLRGEQAALDASSTAHPARRGGVIRYEGPAGGRDAEMLQITGAWPGGGRVEMCFSSPTGASRVLPPVSTSGRRPGGDRRPSPHWWRRHTVSSASWAAVGPESGGEVGRRAGWKPPLSLVPTGACASGRSFWVGSAEHGAVAG